MHYLKTHQMKSIIGGLNEFRNALDHLVRIFGDNVNSQDIDKQINECQEHLVRCGFDAMDVLCVEYLRKTEYLLAPFFIDLISTICPEVYSNLMPNLNRLMKTCSNIKAKKYDEIVFVKEEQNHKTRLVSIFDNYYKVFNEIYKEYEKVFSYVNPLSKAKRENRRKRIVNFFLTLIAGALIGLFAQKIIPKIPF